MCFCRNHKINITKLSEALIQVSTSCDNPSAAMDHLQMEDAIDRIESAAEFFPYGECWGDAFQLYTLFLKWALNHEGRLCQCALDLVHRARVECALSALDRSDLEAANSLFEQTESHFPPKHPTSSASWLYYEYIFTWKLYKSRGWISSRATSYCFRRLNEHSSLGRPTNLERGAIICDELSFVVEHADAAKSHVEDLLQRFRDCPPGSPDPSIDYSMRAFDLGAVKSCLRWMQDTNSPSSLPVFTGDKCPRQDFQVCSSHGNSLGPAYYLYDFLAYWTRLRSELEDSTVPVWFNELMSGGLRPTEFLAVMAHGLSVFFKDIKSCVRRPYPMAQVPIYEPEIIREIRYLHASLGDRLIESQLMRSTQKYGLCRSTLRDLVREHLAITSIPGYFN